MGIGAVKYADLSKKQNHRLYFRLGSDVKFFEGNTAPYIQYAHTKVLRSIFKRAEID